jgi:CubicO group peptidase (beta-lactamase class C family)
MRLLTKILPALLPFLFTNINAQTIPPRSVTTTQNVSANNVRIALEDYFQKAAGLGFSGAVLVAKDGKILLRNGYGWADVKRQIPIKPDTIFDIGSGIKAFTATAVMQLEEQGKLNTSDLMSKYIKHVPADKKDITIHQLLTHTSGLNFDYFYDVAGAEDREIMRNREKYIKGVLGYPLAFKPGEGRLYSNSGFSLLAAIIEVVSGKSYEQYMREHLFKPAGIMETGYYIPRDLQRVARGYNDGDTDYGYPWETQWDGKRPLWDLMGNGGVLTTLDDVYKWLLAIKGERLVSQKSKDKMFQIYYPKSDQGLGWDVGQTEGKTFVFHPGDAVPQGWNTDFRWYKDDDLFIVILSNRRTRAGSLRRYAMPQIVNTALLNKSAQLPAFAKISPAKLRRLEGTYKLESGALFRVTSDETAIDSGKTKPVLIIGGAGQQAIDLLFSANQTPDITKLSIELNDKTEKFIQALRDNNANSLKTILPEDSPTEEALKRWSDFVKGNGELEKMEILGTSPLNQQGVQTFVRLKFKNSAAGVYKVTWRNQKLHEQEEDRLQPAITSYLRKSFVELPLNLPFLPQSETEFAAYDLFKGRTVKVSFPENGNLVVHTKDGDIIAQKVKTNN